MGYDEATMVHFKNHQSSQGEIESKIFQLVKVFREISEISFSHEFIEFYRFTDDSIRLVDFSPKFQIDLSIFRYKYLFFEQSQNISIFPTRFR